MVQSGTAATCVGGVPSQRVPESKQLPAASATKPPHAPKNASPWTRGVWGGLCPPIARGPPNCSKMRIEVVQRVGAHPLRAHLHVEQRAVVEPRHLAAVDRDADGAGRERA